MNTTTTVAGSAEDQAKLWGASARGWADRLEPLCESLWLHLLSFALVTKGKRFLDAGCGTGGASVIAANLGAEVTGFDATAELLEIAKERVPQGRFDQGDLESLPYDDQSFDAIIAVNSIQFTYHPEQALAELRRVRAQDGMLAVALFTPAEQNGFAAVMQPVRALAATPAKVGPFALSAHGVLDAAIAKARLHIVREEEVPCDWVFANTEELWLALAASGATQAAMKAVGEAKCREVISDAAKPFIQPHGVVQLKNRLRCVCLE